MHPKKQELKKLFLLVALVVITLSCDKKDEENVPKPNPEAHLLFSSGFEEGTFLTDPVSDYEINNWPGYKLIKGTDSISGFAWPPDILGSTFGGIHIIDDDNGAGINNEIQSIVGHTGESSKVLFQRINYNSGVTQAPYQINSIQRNPDKLYMSFWMKIDASSVSKKYDWRAIWEYKTANWDAGNGFRMIAYIERDEFGVERWRFQGDSNPNPYYWSVSNYLVPVPREEWFKVEIFFKWSTGDDGYASMKINGEIIAENYGPTTYNDDNLGGIFIHQIYGSSTPMFQWVDDIEIWDDEPFK